MRIHFHIICHYPFPFFSCNVVAIFPNIRFMVKPNPGNIRVHTSDIRLHTGDIRVHTSDIRVHTIDIQMTYECIRVNYG